ncbi:DNA double-strand break repair nuclease NurA [Candidatus Dependentiae bacterium]|nr:DNA double-strand break repair nuclease NurA [Candidatus Dependentiae bacterium]
MLDRLAVHRLVAAVPATNVDDAALLTVLQHWFARWLVDPMTVYHDARQLLPAYDEQLSVQRTIPSLQEPMTIIGIDGSQIYPDRHQGTMLGLLQLAAVALTYQQPQSSMHGHTDLQLIDGMQAQYGNGTAVDAARYCAELAIGIQVAPGYQPSVVMLDGSLIAWQLQELGMQRQQEYVALITQAMEQYRQQQLLHVAYISSPNTKELLSLIVAYAQQQGSIINAEQFVDAAMLRGCLAVGQVTPWLLSRAPVTALYPEQLRPWFCYINTGTEIGRLEIPHWLFTNHGAREQILAAVMQQLTYGYGFPVVLSQAHAATVITAADRDYFYTTIARLHGTVSSTKNRLKQRMPY